jgi:hypothetical protein
MTCADCNQTLNLRVYRSAAGYYIGRQCECGPYSRESHYFDSYMVAEYALESGNYEKRQDAYAPSLFA